MTLDQRQQNIRSYIPGSGLVKLRRGIKQGVNDDRFLLNIPKNASSYLYSWTTYHEWQVVKAEDMFQTKELVAVLRNPLDRWVSGFAQYITSYILNVYGPNGPLYPGIDEPTEHDCAWAGDDFVSMYNPLVERLIFDVIDRFDDHTQMQGDVIRGLFPHAKKTYFMMEEIDSKLGPYLELPPAGENIDRNLGSSNPSTRKVQEFIQAKLHHRPDLVKRVKKRYKPDYDFIKQARPDVEFKD